MIRLMGNQWSKLRSLLHCRDGHIYTLPRDGHIYPLPGKALQQHFVFPECILFINSYHNHI